jgi:hypothetical protein
MPPISVSGGMVTLARISLNFLTGMSADGVTFERDCPKS